MIRREVPLFITMGVGWFMVVEYFSQAVEPVSTELQSWAIIMTALASVLGVVNVARINLLKVSRKQEDWQYGIFLLVGMAVMILLGTLLPMIRSLTGMEGPAMVGAFDASGVTEGTWFYQFFNHLFVPMQATMFALLAFFIASAAFRAFRVRSLDASLLAVTAVIVMLGRVPLGDAMSGGFLPALSDWIMNVPNLAAKRAPQHDSGAPGEGRSPLGVPDHAVRAVFSPVLPLGPAHPGEPGGAGFLRAD